MKKVQNSCSDYLNSKCKRFFDLSVSILFLLPVAILIFIISLLVLIINGRPVFFIQKRTGKNGQIFSMPKIRTLKVDTDPNLPAFCQDIDSCATRTGRFLRKYRLDELPQIFSVLKGDMSLVGPRPELPQITANYSQKHMNRLFCRPGITGIWQINADRNAPIHKDIKYDLYYLKKASLRTDIKVLYLTLIFIFNQKKANHENRLHLFKISMQK